MFQGSISKRQSKVLFLKADRTAIILVISNWHGTFEPLHVISNNVAF